MLLQACYMLLLLSQKIRNKYIDNQNINNFNSLKIYYIGKKIRISAEIVIYIAILQATAQTALCKLLCYIAKKEAHKPCASYSIM